MLLMPNSNVCIWNLVHYARQWRKTTNIWEESFMEDIWIQTKFKLRIWKKEKRGHIKNVQQTKYWKKSQDKTPGVVWSRLTSWRNWNLIRNVLTKKINKKRPRGRCRQWWIDRIVKNIKEIDEGITI
jgi:hypothetical protein